MVASQHFFCFITFTFYVFCQTKTVPKWQDPKQICLHFFFAKIDFVLPDFILPPVRIRYTMLRCIHLLNTCKYWDNTRKYCVNTHKYWPNIRKMCSPASAIFGSIVTLLVSYEAILMYYKACGISLLWNWCLKLMLTENHFKIASKLSSIVTILAKIALAVDHIFQVLAQYSWVLPIHMSIVTILASIEQVNTPLVC